MAIIGPDICLKVSCVQIWQKKVQKEVSQIANRKLSRATAIGGLSVNLNHLKTKQQRKLPSVWFDLRTSYLWAYWIIEEYVRPEIFKLNLFNTPIDFLDLTRISRF